MTRFLPLAAVAGALACVVAVGSAQAAPASGNILGKLTTASEAGTSVEKAGYYHHRVVEQAVLQASPLLPAPPLASSSLALIAS